MKKKAKKSWLTHWEGIFSVVVASTENGARRSTIRHAADAGFEPSADAVHDVSAMELSSIDPEIITYGCFDPDIAISAAISGSAK